MNCIASFGQVEPVEPLSCTILRLCFWLFSKASRPLMTANVSRVIASIVRCQTCGIARSFSAARAIASFIGNVFVWTSSLPKISRSPLCSRISS